MSGRFKHSALLSAWFAGLSVVASTDAALAEKITPAELCFRKAYAEKLTAIILNEGVGAVANAQIDRAELLSACNASVAPGPQAQAPGGAIPEPSGAAAPIAVTPDTTQKPPSSSPPSAGEAPQPNGATGASADSAQPQAPPKTGWVNKPEPNASNAAGEPTSSQQSPQQNSGRANKPGAAPTTAGAGTPPQPKGGIAPAPNTNQASPPPSVASPKDLESATPSPPEESDLGKNAQPRDATITDGAVVEKPDEPASDSEEGLPLPPPPTRASEEGLPLAAKPAPRPEATNAPDKPNDVGAAPDVSADKPNDVGKAPADTSPGAGTGGGLLGGLGKAGTPPEASSNNNASSATGGGTSDTSTTPNQPASAGSTSNTQPTGQGATPNQAGAQADTIEAQQQEALRTVQAWRETGSPAWFKSGLPMVKKWLSVTDWSPDAGDLFAAQVVYLGLNVMWLDNQYRDRVKDVDAAAKSCSRDQWDVIDEGLLAGTQEVVEWTWRIPRNEILRDLQRSCIRLQHEFSLGCADLVPFDSKVDAASKSLIALRQGAPLNCCAVRGGTREESKALFRADYIAAVKALRAKIDTAIAALEPILQARAKAIDAALAKVGSVETKRTLLGLGTGATNPAARTLRAKLQNISVYEKVMRAAAGHPDGTPRNRWSEYADVIQKKTSCEICWFNGECSEARSASSHDYGPISGRMPGSLRDLVESVAAEIQILTGAYHAETAAETQASYDERNKAGRDKIVQAYEDAKARNAEAQAKRGTADDPDGKLADKAAADEAKAKHDLDLRNCIDRLAKELREGITEEKLARWNTALADCEAEISGKAVASNAPPNAPVKPKGVKPPLPPVPPRPEGARPLAEGPLPQPEPGPPQGVKPPQPVPQTAAGTPPTANPKPGGGGPAGPPQQVTGLPVAPQGGNPAPGQKPGETPLTPEQFGKAVQDALEKLGVKPRAIAAGEPMYNEFSPWLAQKAGLDVQTAIVAAAFQEKVPIERLMELTKLSRDDVAKSLDVYLQSLKGIASADERNKMVRPYIDSSQAAVHEMVR